MTVQADPKRGERFYNRFYNNGGWKYSLLKEYLWHRRHLVSRFGLRRGMRILEVACGTGFHTNLLNRMGFECIGVDRSSVGIEWAQAHYPKSTYHCCDISGDMPVEPGSFDVVYARGCSHYHYDLFSEKALRTTTHLMGYLKPGGVFVMVIVSDLSGRMPPGKIRQNTLADYERHFSSFGHKWSVAWHKNMVICGLYNQPLTVKSG
jgi:SAM-dependent methyltransferase